MQRRRRARRHGTGAPASLLPHDTPRIEREERGGPLSHVPQLQQLDERQQSQQQQQ